MSRTNAIPDRPDVNAARRAAFDFILENANQISYPLDPLIFYTGDRCILPLSEACKLKKYSDFFDLARTGAEARTNRARGTNSYLTVYDDSMRYFERLKFTYAHELGHIVCGHLDKYEKTSLCRGGLTKVEYRVLEEEADHFAGQLLAPVPLLFLLGLDK